MMTSEHAITPMIALPRLGAPAPAFEAETTHGTVRLEDFRGSWLILFSPPADFTPVCTTEFIAFAKLADTLKARNVELMGLSIDSTYSHIAWVRNIEQNFGVKIPFPVIADLDKKVATLYGMIMPGESKTETSRYRSERQHPRDGLLPPHHRPQHGGDHAGGAGPPDYGPARGGHPGQLATG